MTITNIHEAKTNLSRLIQQVVDGEEVIIAKSGKPIVKMVRYECNREPRCPGVLRGKIKIAPDFDDLPEEIANAFQGKNP